MAAALRLIVSKRWTKSADPKQDPDLTLHDLPPHRQNLHHCSLEL